MQLVARSRLHVRSPFTAALYIMLAGSRTLQRPPLWSIPVSDRPYSSLWLTLPLSIAFVTVFDVGLLATFFLLVLLYPLSFSAATRRRYRHLGKAAFGRLLVVVVEWFSPTELVLTAGQGIDAERWIERDGEGHVQALRLPDKALWVSATLPSKTFQVEIDRDFRS